MEAPRLKLRFRVHSFDTDAFGVVTVPRLLGYLLEAAGASADSLGFGIRELQQRGLTWVLGRIRIVIDQAACFGDTLEIETWPSGLERSVATRESRILRGDDVVGSATSLWFVLDMESRIPVRPHEILPEWLHPQTPRLVELSRTIAPLAGPVTVQRQFDIRQSDIDLNRHVTAASYLAWAMDAVPDELWLTHRAKCLDVQFMEECHLGSAVLSESCHGQDGGVSHRVSRRSDGRELARLLSQWVVR